MTSSPKHQFQKMDEIYRSFIIRFARILRQDEIQDFRFFCNGILKDSQLHDSSVVDIVKELERADELSYYKLGFLKRFLDVISHNKLLNELIEIEAKIQVVETIREYIDLKLLKDRQEDTGRVAEGLLRINEQNSNLTKIINKKTTYKECEGIHDTLSTEVLKLLESVDVTWKTVRNVFAVYCELEAAVNNKKIKNVGRCTSLYSLISRLITKLGGWEEFLKNLKQMHEQIESHHQHEMRRKVLDAVYCGSPSNLLENQRKSSIKTSCNVIDENKIYHKKKPYDRVTRFLKHPFTLSFHRSSSHPRHNINAHSLVLRHG